MFFPACESHLISVWNCTWFALAARLLLASSSTWIKRRMPLTFLLYQEMQLLLVQELQKRGYFRNSMDLCVSLWFGLQSVFETCWNICYQCMNNAAIYNSFSGKRGLSWPWPPGEAVCLRGNCICFGSLLKKTQAPALLKVRWCLWAVPWPGRALSRAACAQMSPKPGSWGSSRLSRAKSLNHL